MLYPDTRYTSRSFAITPIDRIKAQVSIAYAIPDLEKRRREMLYTVPRYVAMFLCVCAGHSTTKTAQAFGRADHTNAIYARKRVQFWMSENEEFAMTVRDLAVRCGFALEVER